MSRSQFSHHASRPRARLRLALSVAAVALSASAASATDAAAKPPPSFFGVSPQTAMAAKDYARMGQGKVGTLRIAIPWSVVDSTAPAGGYDWTFPDSIIAEAARNGIDVLPVLYATPAWVAKDLDGYNCSGNCFLYSPKSAAARNAWQQFAGAAVKRYGPDGQFWESGPTTPPPTTPPPTEPPPPCLIPLLCKASASLASDKATATSARAEVCGCTPHPIHVWQIWNEQNSSSFYLPKPSPGTYAKLLGAAAKAIRAKDAGADVILGGMAELAGVPKVTPASRYLAKLYDVRGVEKNFDGVSSHPYSAKLAGVRKQIGLLRGVMGDAHDKRASMWVTEIGWGSEDGGNPLSRGTAGQASSLSQAYKYFTSKRGALNLKVVVWFTWMDSPSASVCAWCGRAGLFDTSFQPKPVWSALTKFTGGS